MYFNFFQVVRNSVISLFCLLILISCGGRDDVFVAEVETIASPEETVELTAEKIDTDDVYSEWFAVYDSLLISSLPNSNDCFFYVADIKNDTLLGTYLRHGQGPSEYLGLNPVSRIERKGDDLVALTYEPNRKEIIEWNITKSIETGQDSVLQLGKYSNDYGTTFADIYKIGKSKYLGYTPSFIFEEEDINQVPSYWVFDGAENTPEKSISFVKSLIHNKKSKIWEGNFFSSSWSLSPDNSKIVNAMDRLKQINIIDLGKDNVKSYRVAGSPDESIFHSSMENPVHQYHDVVCNDDVIYALYFGDFDKNFGKEMGCHWLHEYDWNGTLKKEYHLSVPIKTLWLDPSSDTLYGYSEAEGAVYKLNVSR